ncbi:hypothetical protein QYF36_015619 [Acer negundo]|nr:hypothetical protein QYF36_015619 [Acer negundo]
MTQSHPRLKLLRNSKGVVLCSFSACIGYGDVDTAETYAISEPYHLSLAYCPYTSAVRHDQSLSYLPSHDLRQRSHILTRCYWISSWVDGFHPMLIDVCHWRIVPCFGNLLDLELNVE